MGKLEKARESDKVTERERERPIGLFNERETMCVCACLCVCVSMCARVRTRGCVRGCVLHSCLIDGRAMQHSAPSVSAALKPLELSDHLVLRA